MKNRHSLSDTHSKGNGRLKGFTRDCIIALCSILSPGFDALTRAYRPSLRPMDPYAEYLLNALEGFRL